jgi:hypothetical protein
VTDGEIRVREAGEGGRDATSFGLDEIGMRVASEWRSRGVGSALGVFPHDVAAIGL